MVAPCIWMISTRSPGDSDAGNLPLALSAELSTVRLRLPAAASADKKVYSFTSAPGAEIVFGPSLPRWPKHKEVISRVDTRMEKIFMVISLLFLDIKVRHTTGDSKQSYTLLLVFEFVYYII